MRCAAFLLCVLLPLTAAAEDKNKPIGLKGAPGVVTPPTGEWTQRNESLAPGQWHVEYRSKDGKAMMRAHVFPARPGSEPEPTLVQAVDVFFRGMNVGGFGLPTKRAVDVFGCPGAAGSLMASIGGGRVTGEVRVVRLTQHQWGLAIGYAPETAAAQRAVIRAFVRSLEPQEPVFYDRRFHDPASLDRVAVVVPGGDKLTAGHIAATVRVIEAGIDDRFPLAILPPLKAAMRADARKGTTKTRQGYRDTAEALKTATGFEPAKRDDSLTLLGRRVIDAILKRANSGYEPAVEFARAFNEARGLRAGKPEDGLTAGALASRMEMSEFLASIGADRELKITGEPRQALVRKVHAAWKDVSAEDREAWRKIGVLWAALRYAWDTALPEARFAFRKAVMGRLWKSTTFDSLATTRLLKRHMIRERKMIPDGAEGIDAFCVDRAFDLTPAERRALIDVLGVKDAYGFHFGW